MPGPLEKDGLESLTFFLPPESAASGSGAGAPSYMGIWSRPSQMDRPIVVFDAGSASEWAWREPQLHPAGLDL